MACHLGFKVGCFWLLMAVVLASMIVEGNTGQSQSSEIKNSEPGTAINSVAPVSENPGQGPRFSKLYMTSAPNYVMVEDFNSDGRLDLGFTSHGGNHSRLFLQLGSRQWHAGPEITEVGFHPGELIGLSGEDGNRTFLMLAEGENKLRVMTPTAEGGLTTSAEIEAIFPRAGTQFRWPGWGIGLAFAPFNKAMIVLAEGFQPDEAAVNGAHFLSFRPAFARTQHVAAADLGGDGIDEILFMNPATSKLMVIRYPCGDARPTIEELWAFDQAGPARFVIPADIDQDGDMDILVPGEAGQATTGITALNILVKDDSGGWIQGAIPIPAATQNAGGVPGLRGTAFGIDKDGMGYVLTAGYDRLSLVKIPFGWDGDEHAIRQVKLTKRQGIPTVALNDLDQDGWLDAVLAGGMGDTKGGMVLYGPLWDSFADLDGEDMGPAKEAPTPAVEK